MTALGGRFLFQSNYFFFLYNRIAVLRPDDWSDELWYILLLQGMSCERQHHDLNTWYLLSSPAWPELDQPHRAGCPHFCPGLWRVPGSLRGKLTKKTFILHTVIIMFKHPGPGLMWRTLLSPDTASSTQTSEKLSPTNTVWGENIDNIIEQIISIKYDV